MEALISAERITEILNDCLFKEDELENDKPKYPFVEVRGITMRLGFHKERLLSYKDEVKTMLLNLHEQFQANKGGGWSFLNACQDKNKVQWTNFHQRMEELFMLGLGLGLCKFTMSREIWPLMPGGMPYITVTANGGSHDTKR